MRRTYRFLNVGNTGGYGDAYTQDGKHYFGFQPLSDGKIAFLRKELELCKEATMKTSQK